MKRISVTLILIWSMLLSACSPSVPVTTPDESVSATSALEDTVPDTTASAAESTEAAQDPLYKAIFSFCEMLYGSLDAESTVTFGWDDFDSIEGYMIAKWIETRRECSKIDHADISNVRVLSVTLQGSPAVQGEQQIQSALVHVSYVTGSEECECVTRYVFTLQEGADGYRVTDLTTYNPAYSLEPQDDMDIAVLRDSLDLWKDECKDAGDMWQFEAVDRIMEQKKVPLEDLIDGDFKEELDKRRKQTSKDAEVVDIRFNEYYDRPDSPMTSGMTFRDGTASFWVSFTYLDLYDVLFSDDSIKTVGEALELGLIGRSVLDTFGIPYETDSSSPEESEPEQAAENPDREQTSEGTSEEQAGTSADPETTEGTAHTQAPSSSGRETVSDVSRYYSQEDIELAKEAVIAWMTEHFETGTRISELYYPGDDFTERAEYGSFDTTENSLLLGGCFVQADGTERGSSGYPAWVWILRRTGGGWTVVDAGY